MRIIFNSALPSAPSPCTAILLIPSVTLLHTLHKTSGIGANRITLIRMFIHKIYMYQHNLY